MSSAAADGMDSELLSWFMAENEIAVAAEKITKMEPGLELKMNAFVMWAGPMILAALGVAPSKSNNPPRSNLTFLPSTFHISHD